MRECFGLRCWLCFMSVVNHRSLVCYCKKNTSWLLALHLLHGIACDLPRYICLYMYSSLRRWCACWWWCRQFLIANYAGRYQQNIFWCHLAKGTLSSGSEIKNRIQKTIGLGISGHTYICIYSHDLEGGRCSSYTRWFMQLGPRHLQRNRSWKHSEAKRRMGWKIWWYVNEHAHFECSNTMDFSGSGSRW